MPAILVFRRLNHEVCCEFEASLDYERTMKPSERFCFEKTSQTRAGKMVYKLIALVLPEDLGLIPNIHTVVLPVSTAPSDSQAHWGAGGQQ